ncbi:Cation/hydrogen exchanger family protein [Euphorbia peplus]|nr:Cation/hydrogen exchanger family protein [Euphorbia peplus]
MWNVEHGESILQHSFIRFHIQLVSMFFISHFFHLLLKRCHLPRLTSDILAGFLLGPSFFGRYFPHASSLLYSPSPDVAFASLLKIGFVLFTFLTAVRVDVSYTKRIAKQGAYLGGLLFLFSTTFGQTLKVRFNTELPVDVIAMYNEFHHTMSFLNSFIQSQFVDVSMCLMHLRLTNTKLGQLALSASMIHDLVFFAYISYGYLTVRMRDSESNKAAILSVFLLAFFLLIIFVLMRTMLLWFIRITPEGKPIKNLYTNIFLVFVLISSAIGDNIGLDYLYGPFCIGLITPAGSPLAINVTQKLDTIVYGLLIPLLCTFVASKVDLIVLFTHFDTLLKLKIGVIGFLLMLVASFLFGLMLKLSHREAASLALILCIKGTKEMGLTLSYFPIMGDQCLDGASAVVLVFVLTTFSPPIIKWLYDPTRHYVGYHKKCIQFSSNESDLGILACARKQGDAMAAIKLLELSNPTKQSPITVYGLCLEELVSSYNPLIINHQLGQKTSSLKGCHTQPIIDVFQYFKVQFKNSTQVNVFTSVAPLQQMHEDICWIAFEKSCCMIIIPFHKRWNDNGTLVSNNSDDRKLNITMFDRAPCSVGLLINRQRTRGLSSIFAPTGTYNVVVMFLGGADDREALAYAMRMAKNRNVHLTVITFLADFDIPAHTWEDMLDSESLRKLKEEMHEYRNVSLVEEIVRDGSDTAGLVCSAIGKNDLIMVGRKHHTKKDLISGLSQWTEFPELGVLGDILASSDSTSAVSVLVIQQQITKVSHSSILNERF